MAKKSAARKAKSAGARRAKRRQAPARRKAKASAPRKPAAVEPVMPPAAAAPAGQTKSNEGCLSRVFTAGLLMLVLALVWLAA